ncbi:MULTISPECIES: aminotransferase class I/II-fold pyridoxal phosphate-dependent enzyme [unclassified Variovorax]|uniref:aminotransferase class I/II-fold pyridoxal phosphate-dependent enzyme n=1 Tax=unclassified Variovorax TaxID=663243 RepID=UPI00076C77FC|nr:MULTISPECIES: aminotransferase class I/II-fold pyridoxal phosphate-dependent enzyme [unclassified Variovorax]KWT89405.1 L-threonine 3-O-phosphate decarboxylase [Variovorax sp. WDL1]PNG56583.1 putative phenylalanine aminotransferase [Variovorax sp. B4]PNG58007.1 putative phenylalanine aminotransferase [Variovorax sp. B2]VTV09515.1 Histidinol-phosphate aminotransferase 2 [Variovorax sp. WDL1]
MNADEEAFHGGPDARGAVPHDFSTNANACGPCPMAVQALQQADASRYPDPRYTTLRETLGQFHGVAAERIVIAASASEFIARITAAVAQQGGRPAWLPRHAYGDYLRAAEAWGLDVRREPESPAGAALAWCCDPSSPLGAAQPGLAGLVDALDASSICVLDLAYEPLRLEGRLDLGAAQRDRVWQLWTPNKALGLTGVRAAYAIAPRDAAGMAERLGRLAPSWPLGAHGVALLEAWTLAETQAWLATSRDRLRGWKHEQQALCAALGWSVLPSIANYFCARLDVPYAQRSAALREAGIQLRDARSFGLPGHVRLAVLPPASQAALARTWQAAGA